METQAYFEDIQFQIKKELAKANYSIQIAVAWFTDKEIFDLLCKKAQKNVKIELIILNDKINKNSGIEFDLLNKLGSNFWFVGSGDEYENIMHNKFCIIDYETIITGSYNWTIKAQNNHENITIIKENPELAKQFTAEINSIKEKYLDIHTDSFNISKILIRLETLKNIIVLEDTEDIHYQVKKIKLLIKNQNQTDVLSKVNDIIVLIEKSKFSKSALFLISRYILKG
jgi:phosphatidylserine/phosphatidylglycerophosphate/cardiolipin synthase-like enzyme